MLRSTQLALLGVLCLAGHALARPGGPKSFQMSASAILFYDCEYGKCSYQQSSDPSQCEMLLTRALRAGSRSVNIVPTQYWMQESYRQYSETTCYPDHWATISHVSDSPDNYFCHKREWNSPCEPWTKEAVAEYTQGLTKCIAKARELFDEVLLSPHLDDGTKTMHWRNMLWMDPLADDKYGFSYWDIMIKPLLDAVNAAYGSGNNAGRKLLAPKNVKNAKAVKAGKRARGTNNNKASISNVAAPTNNGARPRKTIMFSPQGEMGGTVFQYPGKYLEVVKRIRSGFTGPADVLDVGLLFNHAYLPGVVNRKDDAFGALPKSEFWKQDGGWGELLPFEQWPRYEWLKARLPLLHQLLDTVDYLGISNYARAGENPSLKDIESAIRKYDAELTEMGFDLKAWRNKPGKRFIMNEFGIGGGVSECGDVTAKTRKETGLYPWLGATKSFGQMDNPWMNPVAREYVKDYYQAAIDYAEMGGLDYKVDGMFIWTIVSWDIWGIHPASSVWGCDPSKDTSCGTYAIPEVAAMVTAHNKAH